MTDTHTGSCNCGAVRFRTAGILRGIVYCHCSQCRKQSGHFFAATSVEASRLEIDGEDAITWYAGSPQALRGFCRICGAALFWRQEGGDTVSILAGAFDKPTGLDGLMHIFAADKGDYYAIDDGLPVHAQWWPDEPGAADEPAQG
ncbi:GFA family protein [Mesorhizobium sp. ASY16-5R]|uniref:GFA family protein n=1 Tax=Mesorhizobium sp. ASY16-5R TaxID=3445772 RepID=UPI003F9FD303